MEKNYNYKVRRFLLTLFAIFIATASLNNNAFAVVINYQVKKGDTLSTVLFDHNLEPLYGKHGYVKLTRKLNKNKIKKNGNFVFVGQIIKLPLSNVIETKVAVVKVEPNKEIGNEAINASRAPSSESPYSRFVYSPHLSFLKIDSSNDINWGGSTVTALSQKGVGADLAWQIFYDDRYSFFAFGSLDYFSFYKDPNYSLDHSNITRVNMGAGGNFDYSSGLKFTSKISLREVSFLDVINPTSVNLESMPVAEIEAGFKTTVFTKKQLMGNWGAHLSGLLPSSRGSYKSKLGYGVGSTFEVTHKNKSLFLTYELRSFQVNEIKNKEASIVLGISFFGEDDK